MSTLHRPPNHVSPTPADEVDGRELATALGRSLRARRKGQGLTLQQLADQCGLSQPFLSQLENGKAMPSLLALHQVAAALETTAQALLDLQQRTDVSLVRGQDTRCFELSSGATVCFLVEGPDHQMEPNLITAQPGAKSGCELEHAGEEMVHVIEGTVEITLRDKPPTQLNTGDTLTYPATIPHEWRIVGEQQARFLIVSSPPSF
jgi:transcriptional regulator with XRE-family HTH domain